jgi:hypothetical protein
MTTPLPSLPSVTQLFPLPFDLRFKMNLMAVPSFLRDEVRLE